MKAGKIAAIALAVVLGLEVPPAQAFNPALVHRAASRSFNSWQLKSSHSGASGDPANPNPDRVDTELVADVRGVDWRAFRARMVQRSGAEGFGEPHPNWSPGCWAHDIGTVEKGCLLLAHESLTGVFQQTAVLILDHDDARGTLGLILNRPTRKRIAGAPGLGREVQQVLGQCRVLYGGPVGMGGLTALHSAGHAKGSQAVSPKVYVGGLEDLIRLVGEGRADGSSLRLAHGHAAWGPGQLKRELEENYWYVAAVAPELITGPPVTAPTATRLWHLVLQLMGGEYAQVARRYPQP